MTTKIDFKKLTKSWTKYDMVQTIDVIYSIETIEKYISKKLKIDEPILKSFLGIKTLQDPIPEYWIKIQSFPKEKKIFALLAAIFTHGQVVEDFALKYSKGNMKGVFEVTEKSKQATNIRSALVESGASKPFHRREKYVPYDFSIIFYNNQIGPLFKEVLWERITRLTKTNVSQENFYEICYDNLFHKALSLNKKQFRSWLEGEPFKFSYIQKIQINNFFCIKDNTVLDFGESKEIYFLGENGDGKTLLLMALCLAFKGNFISEKTEKKETGEAIDILDKYPNSLSGEDEFGRKYSLPNAISLDNLFGYGTHRGRASAEGYEKNGFMTLFNNHLTLRDPVSWLKNLRLEEEENGNTVKIATSKLQEVLFKILERRVEIIFRGSEVIFKEKGYELTLEQLSEGYRSIIIFVCDLLSKLPTPNINDKNRDIFKTKGVILVDEIDQHLHPRWQRVIVNNLRELLPNMQFFFTTHSPTVIQGASEDAIIYRVYREDGHTKISDPYYRKDLDHLMMNTLITSSLFGLDDARLDPLNNQAVTDDDYLMYRINRIVDQQIKQERNTGKIFLTDNEIDLLIQSALDKELNNEEN